MAVKRSLYCKLTKTGWKGNTFRAGFFMPKNKQAWRNWQTRGPQKPVA